jgi:PleD family two-component response regulator
VASDAKDLGQGDLSVDVLIGQADACLYRSMELGRNRVTSLALPD